MCFEASSWQACQCFATGVIRYLACRAKCWWSLRTPTLLRVVPFLCVRVCVYVGGWGGGEAGWVTIHLRTLYKIEGFYVYSQISSALFERVLNKSYYCPVETYGFTALPTKICSRSMVFYCEKGEHSSRGERAFWRDLVESSRLSSISMSVMIS